MMLPQVSTMAAPAAKPAKRGRPEGKAVDSASQLEDLLQRVMNLEKLSVTHDDTIRALEGFLNTTWLLKEGDELGVQLVNTLAQYNAQKPQKGAHPLGAPRRSLCVTLVQFINAKKLMDENHEFMTTMSAMKQAEEMDPYINFLSVKQIRDGRYLFKFRASRQTESLWKDAVAAITKYVLASGGEEKKDAAPAGPIVREVRSQVQKDYA
eukprot:TRINITY_DN6266_c0_g1_i2.p3 TRINITY_DN6266_c0_g1~~TRINITY_DN6266_c0_g1_i2.p3  ORF type:complete len:209 (+),score=61.79 TRINITY_DN6266_c0_g1_i2:704-1330(+)